MLLMQFGIFSLMEATIADDKLISRESVLKSWLEQDSFFEKNHLLKDYIWILI